MGNLMGRNRQSENSTSQRASLKRQREQDCEEEGIEDISVKRFKLSDGENYLYKTFFLESKNYDVIIRAFNREWRLHRIFLCQSDFFKVMFEGQFMEAQTNAKEIDLKFDDSFITPDSLDSVLASFYSFEINLTKQNIHRILATARYLQCEEIVQKCQKMLTKLVNQTNCLIVYYFANKYSLPLLESFIFDWLLINLMVIKTNKILSQINVDLWLRLIKSPKFVIETEFILYKVLRHYVQLKLIPIPNENKFVTIDPSYFKKRSGEPFLTTEEGRPFADLFRALRIRNLFTTAKEVMEVVDDNLMPTEWIQPVLIENWLSLLSIESSSNIGPCKELVTPEEFEANAMRLSKIIPAPDIHRWRWISLNPVNLNFCFDGKKCLMKRVSTMDTKRLLAGHLTRRIMLRIQVLDLVGAVGERSEEILETTIDLNEEKLLFKLEKEVRYPSILFLEILSVIPNCQARMRSLKSTDIPEPVEAAKKAAHYKNQQVPGSRENPLGSVASDDGINFVDIHSDSD